MYYRESYATPSIQSYTIVEPFVVQAAQSLIGKNAVIETVGDSFRGRVMDAKPDHIVIQSGDSSFFIRLQMIISIMPD
ncbi:DUF2642 domain-containing protein [Bacillus sp. BGMRC 2118]|nr:DUF2642 domain-containing protein [Bacillus sp. BGMRC 2118]